MNRRRRPAAPYVRPPDAPPLREVVAQIAAKDRRLSVLDDGIGRALDKIERGIRARRSEGGPVDVPFPPWGRLGWSGRRGRGWRLVVVDDEGCEDLAAMPRRCRAEACFVLGTLVDRLGLSTAC